MTLDSELKTRLRVLSTVVKLAPHKPGRTALMKFAYLLQTIKHVPLGYRFELYNYGPYDASVLSDLSLAENLKAVKSEVIAYPSGYRYEYSSIEAGHQSICAPTNDERTSYEPEIRWVLSKFGAESASQLELISTVIFADQEARRNKSPLPRLELCSQVKEIKRHFSIETIRDAVDRLDTLNLLSPMPV